VVKQFLRGGSKMILRRKVLRSLMGLGVVGVLALGTMLGLSLRSLAGTASADPAAPNPGHEWTQVEGHGIDGSTYWLGTTAGQALELRVNGSRALRLEPQGWSPNVIGGYSGNSVTEGVAGATIPGGGGANDGSGNPAPNRVTDWGGTVGGGIGNQAGDDAGTTLDALEATVAGGWGNTASGDVATVGGGRANTASGQAATVGGGNNNQASGDWHPTVSGGSDNTASAGDATVGGGYNNQASGGGATVGGGHGNTASGGNATVPGGEDNTAQGAFSFASGHRAKANHAGSFVWADSNDFDFASLTNNHFAARATGGAAFVTAIDGTGAPTSGVFLSSGDNAWAAVSDRSVKANFSPVDGRDVLERLASVPVETWNLKSQEASIRHMGPMAQDFYAAFGLGTDERYISTVDADGVALAAIQGLYQLSQEQAARIQALETQKASLQQRLDGLEARVSALEGGTGADAAVFQASSSGLPATWLVLGGGLALVLAALVLVGRRLAGGRP
jgi:hypothetical protein